MYEIERRMDFCSLEVPLLQNKEDEDWLCKKNNVV